MKGCLGTFIVFMIWTSICFFYYNTGGITNIMHKRAITKSETSDTSPQTQDLTPDTFLSNNDNELSFTHIDSTESKRIANEIEKSITTLDTTNFLKKTPAPKLINEVTTTILRPSYNDSHIVILDEQLINFAADLKKTLLENPAKKVTIIGHTDSTGDNEDNLASGLKKAQQVRWYLTAKRGISASKIVATSQGEENPIEDNTTLEGRALNNRLEIIVN